MKKTSILKRATSIACAAAMVLTLTPFVADTFGSDEGYAYADAAVGSNICMTVPLFVTFGGDAGYDISNPKASVTSNFELINSGKMNTYISGLTSEDTGNASKLFYVLDDNSNTNPTEITTEDHLFSLYPTEDSKNRINFGYGDNSNADVTGKTFFGAKAGEVRDCTFSLNLTNYDDMKNDEKFVGYGINAGNMIDADTTPSNDNQRKYDTVYPLTKLTITISGFDGLVEGGSLTRNTDVDLNNIAFYFKDCTTGEIYDMYQIKSMAKDISEKHSNSPYKSVFLKYASGELKYECAVRYNSLMYRVAVIDADYMGVRGIDFQFLTRVTSLALRLQTTPIYVDVNSRRDWGVTGEDGRAFKYMMESAPLVMDSEVLEQCVERTKRIQGAYSWSDSTNGGIYSTGPTTVKSKIWFPNYCELGYDFSDTYLTRNQIKEFDITGKPMTGFSTSALRQRYEDAELTRPVEYWIFGTYGGDAIYGYSNIEGEPFNTNYVVNSGYGLTVGADGSLPTLTQDTSKMTSLKSAKALFPMFEF